MSSSSCRECVCLGRNEHGEPKCRLGGGTILPDDLDDTRFLRGAVCAFDGPHATWREAHAGREGHIKQRENEKLERGGGTPRAEQIPWSECCGRSAVPLAIEALEMSNADMTGQEIAERLGAKYDLDISVGSAQYGIERGRQLRALKRKEALPL